LHIDARFAEPSEMLLSLIRVNQMERLVALIEAVLDERAKHPVLLVPAPEESANVTLPAETASGEPHGMVASCHR